LVIDKTGSSTSTATEKSSANTRSNKCGAPQQGLSAKEILKDVALFASVIIFSLGLLLFTRLWGEGSYFLALFVGAALAAASERAASLGLH